MVRYRWSFSCRFLEQYVLALSFASPSCGCFAIEGGLALFPHFLRQLRMGAYPAWLLLLALTMAMAAMRKKEKLIRVVKKVVEVKLHGLHGKPDHTGPKAQTRWPVLNLN